MNYQGGKSRLARRFAPVLAPYLPGRRWVEPFVGGFNLLPAVDVDRRASPYCADSHPGLVTLLRAVRDGWDPPCEVSEQRYADLRRAGDWRDPETAFAAFGCSFGAKQWGGYARNAKGDNYAERARKSLLRKRPAMQGVEFAVADYRGAPVDERSIVYADPPYAGTLGYGVDFDHDEFYAWCEACAALGAVVVVSEFTRPDRPGWRELWRHERRIQIDSRLDNARKVELLLRVASE